MDMSHTMTRKEREAMDKCYEDLYARNGHAISFSGSSNNSRPTSPLIPTRYLDAHQRDERDKGKRPLYDDKLSQHETQGDELHDAHINATYTNNLFQHSRPSSPLKTSNNYMSDRLKRIEHEKKAFQDEHIHRQEQIKRLELEKQALQEEKAKLLARKLHGPFNHMHISGGNGSPPSTPPRTPRSRRHSRSPSRSPSPRGRRVSRHDHHRRQTPPRSSKPSLQHANHGSQYGGSNKSFNHASQDFMHMQQEPLFQQYVEKFVEQNQDQFLTRLIDKGAKVPYNFDVDRKIKRQDPSQEEQLDDALKQAAKVFGPKNSFSLDSICPSPFDKSVDMKEFPRKVEILQYDKYDGSGDPHDHM
jgi:hypothetical protein